MSTSSTLTKIVKMVETLSKEEVTKLQHFLELYSTLSKNDDASLSRLTVHVTNTSVPINRQVYYKPSDDEMKSPNKNYLSGNKRIRHTRKQSKPNFINKLECPLDDLIYLTEDIDEIIKSEINDWRQEHGDTACPNNIKKQIKHQVWEHRDLIFAKYS